MDLGAALSALAAWLATDPQKTVLAFVLGAGFNALIAEWRARSEAKRQASVRREERLFAWELERFTETRRSLLAYMEWLADIARETPRKLDASEFPRANYALLGDAGGIEFLRRLPINMDLPKQDRLMGIAALRYVLMHQLDQQERRLLRGEAIVEMSADLANAMSALPPAVRTEPEPPAGAASEPPSIA